MNPRPIVINTIISIALAITLAVSFDLSLDILQRAIFHSDIGLANGAFWSDKQSVHISAVSDLIPAQIPGPLDQWAGSESKHIYINIPFKGPYTITAYFLDSHNSSPPKLSFYIDEVLVKRELVSKGRGLHSFDWKSKGAKSNLNFSATGSGDGIRHSLKIVSESGSWVAIEKIAISRSLSPFKIIFTLIGWIFLIIYFLKPQANALLLKNISDIYILIFCAAMFLFLLNIHKGKSHYPDTAIFGEDTWEYQSMGANLTKGHGVSIFGGFDSIEQYKFNAVSLNNDPVRVKNFIDIGDRGGIVNILRMPGYPMFIGTIYSVYGVSPRIAKLAQLILILIISSFLPWLMHRQVGWLGFIPGMFAGYLFSIKWAYELSNKILTEPLIAYISFITLVMWVILKKDYSNTKVFVLGICLALNPLVKGSLIFVPLLFFVLLFFENISESNKINQRIKLVSLAILGFVITIAPWFLYASYHQGSFILFSSQPESILLDNNNEYSLDGDWHPEWRYNKESYYLKDEIKNLPNICKVLSFYADHIAFIPEIFFNKMNKGFNEFKWMKLLMILIIANCLSALFLKVVGNKGSQVSSQLAIWFPYIVIVTSFLGDPKTHGFIALESHILVITALIAYLLTSIIINEQFLIAPKSMLIYLVNIILVVLITYGTPRFVLAFDYIFMAISGFYVLATLVAIVGMSRGKPIDI